MKNKTRLQFILLAAALGGGASFLFAQTPGPAVSPTPGEISGLEATLTLTPNGTASPTPGCGASGANASSKAARNYSTWCDPVLSGIIYEQSDANNGVQYIAYNSSAVPVDVRIGAFNIVNMDDHLSSGWIRVDPRKQADLGVLRAYDANGDWSGGVTTRAEAAQ